MERPAGRTTLTPARTVVRWKQVMVVAAHQVKVGGTSHLFGWDPMMGLRPGQLNQRTAVPREAMTLGERAPTTSDVIAG